MPSPAELAVRDTRVVPTLKMTQITGTAAACGKSFAEVRMTDYFVKRGTRKCADCACARARAWYEARKTNNPPVITESRNG